MDFSLISGLVSTLKTTYDLGQAAMGVRDANQFATTLAQINDQLLKAQQSLYIVSGQAFAAQQQLAEAQEESRKLKAAAQERGSYTLVKTAQGCFALHSKVNINGAGNPIDTDAPHYVCQPCFDNGRKVVLQAETFMGAPNGLICPICKTQIFV